jgi:hypothetical protein
MPLRDTRHRRARAEPKHGNVQTSNASPQLWDISIVLAIMQRIVLFVLLMLALLATAAPLSAAASHKKAPPKCPPAHSRVMVADPQAEVYLLPERFGGPGGVEPAEIFGCAFRGTRRSYLLGEPPEFSSSGGRGIDLETLAGPMAAYEYSSSGPTGADWGVVVTDLSNGKVVHSVPTGTPAHPEPPRIEGGLTHRNVGIGPATAIVVKSDGAVAWIAEADREGDYQVHALDSAGSRLLATVGYRERSSLALVGSTLYWLQGGKPMSATLN